MIGNDGDNNDGDDNVGDDVDDAWWFQYQFDALHFFFGLKFKLLASPLLLHCEVTLQLVIVIRLNIKRKRTTMLKFYLSIYLEHHIGEL